jgi:glycosyltransferase involved in cell wall biosynthesis
MKISIITPNYNGARFLEETIRSVLQQRGDGVDLEYILVDGGSRDGSLDIIARYEKDLAATISEPDQGPACAINKGLRKATGDVAAWLNSDDRYHPRALTRVGECLAQHPSRPFCFGHCPIVDEQGLEIRKGITRFKEAFFPVSSRFVFQSINYISQPAVFFRRSALEAVGPLREDMTAAWDYEFLLRLWRKGGGVRIPRPPLADFRWHETSISGQTFARQFKEEYDAAVADAGRWSVQAWLHLGVRWGIVASYRLMQKQRARANRSGGSPLG